MDYDSREGITEAVKTLEGFEELRRLRRIAHYDNGETLKQFVVLGRWSLDTCGNCMGAEKSYDVEPILTMPEFFEAIGKDKRVGFGIPTSIPGARDVCPVCNRGWSIRNVHDCHQVNVGQAWFTYHARCYRIKLAKETQKSFEAAFEVAGEVPAFFEPIPNGYYPNVIFYTNWFKVTTPLGQFKVGWRKRVIHLELVDPPEGYNFEELFEGESTTKWKEGIHCWSYVKMAEYISKISGELLERKRDRLWPERVQRREKCARERAEKESSV